MFSTVSLPKVSLDEEWRLIKGVEAQGEHVCLCTHVLCIKPGDK